ncbi:regulator of G-protein signaling 16 isoform 1-T1 [Trichechus inunguis]
MTLPLAVNLNQEFEESASLITQQVMCGLCYFPSEFWLGFMLGIGLLFYFKILTIFLFSKNFSEDVLAWRESFDLLLNSKNGVAAFHAFLKTEFSEENLEFWLACEEFKKIRSATKLASRAHRIFEEFIHSEAPKEVNIDHETRELTRTNLQATTATCFDVAQGKTRTLMEKDSYPRFLKSPAYQDLVAQATAASASASSCSLAEPLCT